MAGDLADMIRAAVAAGSQVHVWPQSFGGALASATVRGRQGAFHVERSNVDPVAALKAALVEGDRLRRDMSRCDAAARDPDQVEIEDLLGATGSMEDLIG
ncbi:hypothetical protein [Sphingopyxis sp. GW247-27LB]|uniref:hypothetical protein n=1 Tax=Sphingopyxis sp. GW247-27LB TaxID=2012632 RepID=UPI001140C80A|nr:hypothetical protein [Sphingopyxis sp. GW247-27LB]